MNLRVMRAVVSLAVLVASMLPMGAAAAAPGGGWHKAELMSAPRGTHSATVLEDGRVLIAGNTTDEPLQDRNVEILDPTTGRLDTAAPLLRARGGHAAVRLLDGTVLVVGGTSGCCEYNLTAERYDPVRDTWTPAGEVQMGRWHPALALMTDGRVILGGGYTDWSPADRSVEIYDPAANSWSLAAEPPSSFEGGSLLPMSDGTVLAVGNWDEPTTSLRYDPRTDTWTPTAPRPRPRGGYAAATLPDGSALFVGGGESTAVDRYDWRTDSWHREPDFPVDLGSGKAAVLADGSVLVTGGYSDYPRSQSKAYIRDAVTGSWSETATPRVPRGTGHELVGLPGGGAVSTGGGSDYTGGSDEIEILDPARNSMPRIAVTAPSGPLPIGEQATLNIDVYDDGFAEPMRGEYLHVEIRDGDGYNYGESGECGDWLCRTDNAGRETFTYTGSGAGTDSVRVGIDTDHDYTLEDTEPHTDVMVRWEAPPTKVVVAPLFSVAKLATDRRPRELTARLTDVQGAGIGYRDLVFYAGNEVICRTMTEENGAATCYDAAGKAKAAAPGAYRVVFEGSDDWSASEGRGEVLTP